MHSETTQNVSMIVVIELQTLHYLIKYHNLNIGVSGKHDFRS